MRGITPETVGGMRTTRPVADGAMTGGDCRAATGEGQEESWPCGAREKGVRSACLASSDRFHGRKSAAFSGALPPAAAQASRSPVNHRRGLMSWSLSVAKREKSLAANLPLPKAPEP